jgi:D-alanyl-D-alanine carboxypeptidase
MTRTVFQNAHGLPDPNQYTTARDMAILGIALREHFPHHYHYFSTRSFTYNGVTYGNHNRLLGNVAGVDGIKTGYINASGFNLVASVKDDGRMIVATVMGGRTGSSRNAHMRELIAENIDEASRGGGGNLIARAGASPLLAANSWTLPDQGPVPTFRRRPETRLAAAYAPAGEASRVSAYTAEAPIVGRDALAEVLRNSRPQAPVPPAAIGTAAVVTAAAAAAAAEQIEAAEVDGMTTASTAPVATDLPQGWVIQVAAMPDRDAAMAFLEQAQAKAGGAVADATPFTVAYNDGGQQLYRARFAGFAGKDAAWDACGALKDRGYGCWATEQ